jgi:hypothetical protein
MNYNVTPLQEYIIEAMTKYDVFEGTKKEKVKQLEKFLKGSYEDYIDKLNELLKDPKTAALLEDAFGGELGNIKLKFGRKNIPVQQLLPTQSEIDLKNSVLYPLCHPECIKNFFKNANSLELSIPLITFNEMFIIDGHHRWSQGLCFNPSCKMVSINFKGAMTPTQMLKATQGAIAAYMSKNDNNDNGIPSSIVSKGFNIFDKNRAEMEDFLEQVYNGVIAMGSDKCNVDVVISEISEFVPSITDRASLTSYICDNVERLKYDHTPVPGAPNRGLMPQTDKAGKLDKDSAIQRMMDDKVLKVK